jgi:hypothetical protein
MFLGFSQTITLATWSCLAPHKGAHMRWGDFHIRAGKVIGNPNYVNIGCGMASP